jgi:diphthamide biosynthesis methyltransferase
MVLVMIIVEWMGDPVVVVRIITIQFPVVVFKTKKDLMDMEIGEGLHVLIIQVVQVVVVQEKWVLI